MKKSFFKKAMTLAVVCAISVESACLIKEKQNHEAEAWVGIQGAAWGAAFGNVAGAVAGAVVGL